MPLTWALVAERVRGIEPHCQLGNSLRILSAGAMTRSDASLLHRRALSETRWLSATDHGYGTRRARRLPLAIGSCWWNHQRSAGQLRVVILREIRNPGQSEVQSHID
jgi:hypothetical protein